MELANLKRSLTSPKGTMDGLGQLVKQSDPDENNFSTDLMIEVLDEIEADLGAQIHVTGTALILREYEGKFRTKRPYLTSMLPNLIGNALKYHQPGVVPGIEIEISEGVSRLKVSVSDNGIWIDLEKDGSLIFRPCKRLLANKKVGFDLGLYIVKRHVEILNGSIYVKSKHGKGSEFEIRPLLKE